ncbi:NAD(P)/FAD-dependent oxidoreductase [Gordonia zhaorongruii]|uniref:NAD(P)/FAD-dependent oxidoreductase n=1 Tax=Gordonia zhaorongruii TaxID=2597659 RepID=UPI00104AA91A|nr:FAD-dependent oxidoreductase [Gordonia zhaorongruii]
MSSAPGVVIVGGGTAGTTAATALRANGFAGPVTLIGAEAAAPYRRTALTKDLLAADLSPERIGLQKPQAWADKGINLITGLAVTGIDAERRVVICDGDREIGYAALILATGGVSSRPGWLGADVPTLRTLPEALTARALIQDAGRLTIVGGGLIGLELAASCAAHGVSVDVVDAAARLLPRVVPECVSDWLADLHRANGVRIRLGADVMAADAHGVTLTGGARLDGPVVAAVGMSPDVRLAAAAGLRTVPEGIVVDGALRTAVSGVYAAGDAAAPPDPLTDRPALGGHWFGATEQGRAAALAVLADLDGVPAQTLCDVPRAWTIQYGVNVQIVGWPAVGGDVAVDGSLADADATVRVLAGGELVGAVTVGRPAEARACRAEIGERLGSTV